MGSTGLVLLQAIFYVLICQVIVSHSVKVLNDRPIIGIVAQEVSSSLASYFPDENYTSYIAASYVKFVESGGARAVPVMINQNDSYYEKIINSVNGVLIPGGATWIYDSGFGEAGRKLYELAVQANEQGDFLPLWGTCLGFEMMAYIAAGRQDMRCDCDSHNQALPLEFTDGFYQSRLFGLAPDDVLSILATQNVTINYHQFCITQKNFTQVGLDSSFRVLSTNVDLMGLRFISSFEAINLPFYGVQFHPEKNVFEWSLKNNGIPHTEPSVRVSQYFADFFVSQARQSSHHFESPEEEDEYLIYKYSTSYTGAKGSTYQQVYYFK